MRLRNANRTGRAVKQSPHEPSKRKSQAQAAGGDENAAPPTRHHNHGAAAGQQLHAPPAAPSAAPPTTAEVAELGLEALLLLGGSMPRRRPTAALFDERTPALPYSLLGLPLPSSARPTLNASHLKRSLFSSDAEAESDQGLLERLLKGLQQSAAASEPPPTAAQSLLLLFPPALVPAPEPAPSLQHLFFDGQLRGLETAAAPSTAALRTGHPPTGRFASVPAGPAPTGRAMALFSSRGSASTTPSTYAAEPSDSAPISTAVAAAPASFATTAPGLAGQPSAGQPSAAGPAPPSAPSLGATSRRRPTPATAKAGAPPSELPARVRRGSQRAAGSQRVYASASRGGKSGPKHKRILEIKGKGVGGGRGGGKQGSISSPRRTSSHRAAAGGSGGPTTRRASRAAASPAPG